MALNIVERPSAQSSSPQQSQSNTSDARARAIAALMGSSGNAQTTPVADPSKISAEEHTAIKKDVAPADAPASVEGQNATNAVEESTAEATTATKEEPISTQYAVLARKEKALRAKAVAQEQQFKAREAALAAREAELSQKSTFDPSKYISIDDLKRDAYGILQKNGVSYDDISQQALLSQSPEAQAFQRMKAEMEQELQKVREEQANTRKSFEEQQAQAYQNALKQIHNEAEQLVRADPAFEMIKETGSVKDVVDLIERTFKEEGTLMTVEQAAQAVEDYLTEEALRIAKAKKVQSRLNPPQAAKAQAKPAEQPAANAAPQSQPAAQQQMKTLTNSVNASRPLSARERALLAFRGELK